MSQRKRNAPRVLQHPGTKCDVLQLEQPFILVRQINNKGQSKGLKRVAAVYTTHSSRKLTELNAKEAYPAEAHDPAELGD